MLDHSSGSSATTPGGNLATTSVITGVMSLAMVMCCGLFTFPLGVTAVITGFMALSQMSRSGDTRQRNTAIAGVVCGGLGMLAVIGLFVFQVAIAAIPLLTSP